MLLIDDFIGTVWVAFLKDKFEAFEKFKIFKNRVENESCLKIKCLRSDRGEEFISNVFNIFCEDNGIKRQISAPKTPQQNGISKRRNKSVSEETREMMFENNVSHIFFGEK